MIRPTSPVLQTARAEAGVVAIITTLAISTILLGIAALAVDLGQAYLRSNDLQDLADRLALAGAKGLPMIDGTGGALTRITDTLEAACANHEEPADLCPGPGEDTVGRWSDGDPDNGEVTFYADAPPGRTPSGPVDDPGGSGEALRVLLPASTVQFGLAAAMGFESTRIQRSASARIGTALGSGVLPFALSPRDVSTGRLCLLDQDLDPGRSCPDGTRPARTLQLARTGTTDPQIALERNIRSGTEVMPVPVTDDPAESLIAPTSDPDLGCATVRFTHRTPCLVPGSTGGYATTLRRGLLESAGNRPGRLTGDTGHGTTTVNGYDLDATSLFESPGLLDPAFCGTTGQPLATLLDQGAPAAPDNRGWITSAAMRSGRLAVLPVIGPDPIGDSTAFPVTDLRYVWIDGDDGGRGTLWDSGQLVGLEGYMVDAGYFPEVVSGSPTVGPYLGRGMPKEVVLLRDSIYPIA